MTLIAFHDGVNNSSLVEWTYWASKLNKKVSFVSLIEKQADKAEIALVWNPPEGRLAELTNLKLICSLGQGVDHLWKDRHIPLSIPIIRLVDANMSHALSQWVMAVLLDFLRDGSFYRQNREKREFNKLPQRSTYAMKTAVYGIGAIGSVVANKLRNFDFEVTGWAQTRKPHLLFKQEIGTEGFQNLLSNNLIHICLLPLTLSTKKLFNQEAFMKMPKGAYFINAGRGEQVDEIALLNAVHIEHLSGAALDVFCEEPLPVSHPFWEEKKISIWPHVAAQTNPETAVEQVIEAIHAIKSGRVPENIVDPVRQY